MIWIVKYKNKRKIDKVVSKLRPSTQAALYNAIEDLKSEGPNPKFWETTELKGKLKGIYRLKIDYRYRMFYEVLKNILTITIVEVSTREKAYK